MRSILRTVVFSVVAMALLATAAAAAYVWSGHYNVGADNAHSGPVHLFLQTVREQSIATHARRYTPPVDLRDPARIRQGAGNYEAMCAGCHLSPGVRTTELSRGLNPVPPDLTSTTVDAAEAFWAIKHGIKASGMPAWGRSMDDAYIWNMVAFIGELPRLDASRYRQLVDESGGHSHGGGETAPHPHPPAADTSPGAQTGSMPPHPPTGNAAVTVHEHADGSQHVHDAPASEKPVRDASPQEPPVAPTVDPPPPAGHEGHHHEH